ncbi:unnamed protein product [Rotaria sp. Silwood1]|nr:unnamed protein product [Rotaria sp. Silwood1]CAF1683147.1 unnamed protein product [Rotaria sp. Silwood1]
MGGVAKLFDGHVLNKSNESVDLNDAKYKDMVIGLYFSAHWCCPCRDFTPKLIEFYKSYGKEKKFEIIFISSDDDDESFNRYYEEMPWLTLAFKAADKKEEIKEKFKAFSIPRLILLDGNSGDTVCSDARYQIERHDTKGEKFPWKSS